MSSRVADQLGTGASFSRARSGVSARRQAVAATTGAPTTGAPDSRLRTLPLEQLAPTRFNPRRNFGAEEDLREFGKKLKKKQLQPAVAVTREAYLNLWQAEAENIGNAQYVLANGERRYRGSLAASLTTLEVVVDDEVAKSRAAFLDAVLSENNDREDLDPIERAIGIQTMVEQLGGKAKVAEHYEKSAGWVTQQMYLLDLVPELQDLVSSGELPVRETRGLVKVPADQQLAAWEARSIRRAEEKAQPRPARRKAQPVQQHEARRPAEAGSFTAVKEGGPAASETHSGPEAFTAVKASNGSPPTDAWEKASPSPVNVPDQRPLPKASDRDTSAPSTEQPPAQMPWADEEAGLDTIFTKLSSTERRKAVGRYLEFLGSAESFVADLAAASPPEYRRRVAELLLNDL
ncbi:ParB/RepB/Spo0J family partition protein [Streptomyces sp. NPDC053560]|uniref:ParB/RepB/Spo0J family partition protein n=1 Tax=Streptomyces sp. NPDC053560 TaxID=3365711 RepID=UPI0037D2BAAC